MKNIRMRRVITLNEFIVFIALFCVSTYALLEHASISISLFSYLKMPMMVLGGICIASRVGIIFKKILKKNYFFVILTLVCMSVILMWTALKNRNAVIGTSPMMGTLRLVMFLIEMVAVMILLAEQQKARAAIRFLFFYVLILVIVNDVLMMTGLLTFSSGKFETYIVGNKFSVSYLHMDLLALWLAQRGERKTLWRIPKWRVAVIAVFVLYICRRIDCMTGVLGIVLLAVLYVWFHESRKKRNIWFTSPVILLIAWAASVIFPFIVEQFVEIPAITYMIENIFSRDTTLTGRTNIYLEYAERMRERWMFGYGFGNGNTAASLLFGYANVQNAVLQWVFQVGVPATCAVLFMTLQFFHQTRTMYMERLEELIPIMALLYTLIILGMIETTLSMAFIFWMGIVFMLVNERKPTAVQKIDEREGLDTFDEE